MLNRSNAGTVVYYQIQDLSFFTKTVVETARWIQGIVRAGNEKLFLGSTN
jgi:hypothetical protein